MENSDGFEGVLIANILFGRFSVIPSEYILNIVKLYKKLRIKLYMDAQTRDIQTIARPEQISRNLAEMDVQYFGSLKEAQDYAFENSVHVFVSYTDLSGRKDTKTILDEDKIRTGEIKLRQTQEKTRVIAGYAREIEGVYVSIVRRGEAGQTHICEGYNEYWVEKKRAEAIMSLDDFLKLQDWNEIR